MKPRKLLGLILIALGIASLFYNRYIGGALIILGLIIAAIPSKKLTHKGVVSEYKHKMSALKAEQKEKALKKKEDALKRVREEQLRKAKK